MADDRGSWVVFRKKINNMRVNGRRSKYDVTRKYYYIATILLGISLPNLLFTDFRQI